MSKMPPWLTLTVRAALKEARYNAMLKASNESTQAFDYGRYRRRRKREERIYKEARALRRRATLEAFRAGVVGENWRRVYNPIAFSDPIFKTTKAKYAVVSLNALRQDWQAELARISQHGPQQFDNDPRTPGFRKVAPEKNFEAVRTDDGTIVRFGETA